MIAMALLFAIIFKKPASEEDEIAKEIICTEAPIGLDGGVQKKNKAQPPPIRKLLENERENRKNIQRTQQYIREAIFYSLFLGLIFITIYSMQDSRAFIQSRGIKNLLYNRKRNIEKVCFSK